jgi:predicted transcriptional regulator
MVMDGDRSGYGCVIGATLQAHRKALRITKADLQLVTGVSVATIKRIETGNEGVAFGSLARIVAALGGRLEVCFGDVDGCSIRTHQVGPVVAQPRAEDAGVCDDRPGAETD